MTWGLRALLFTGLYVSFGSNALADPGRATPATGLSARASVHRAPAQKVRLTPAKRPTPVNSKMLALPGIRALPGRARDIREGLHRYRQVRARVRALRKNPAAKVSLVVKLGSFAVDRIDFHVPGGGPKPKILVIGGIHSGSERVGVESALRFAESLAPDSEMLKRFDVTVIPLATPSALVVRARRNFDGADVNRSFGPGKWTGESRAVGGVIAAGGYRMILDLHGAGPQRNGFFVIRGAPDNGFSSRFVKALPRSKLLHKTGAGTTYEYDSRGVVLSSNEGTLKHWGVANGVVRTYTLEAPSRASGKQQVQGMVTLMHSAANELWGDLQASR